MDKVTRALSWGGFSRVTEAAEKERLNDVFIKLLLQIPTPNNKTVKIKLPWEMGLRFVTGGICTPLCFIWGVGGLSVNPPSSNEMCAQFIKCCWNP